jgi:hypothetical protein
MRLRLFLTLGLVLFLSTFASSNESRRFCGHAAGCKGASEAAGLEQSPAPAHSINGEYSTLLVNKLLYI